MKNDQVRVSVRVRVPPEAAFEVFTKEVDQWWRRGPQFRRGGTLHFECELGGRLFETISERDGAQLAVIGNITVWEPPSRFVFEWRASNFDPGEKTEVEVTFERIPGERDGTMVTVVHRGFSKIRPDHPVRHGAEEALFLRRMGMWWGELMTSLREFVR